MTLNKIKQGIVKGTPLINYKEIGKGPPVIFLHGIGGNSENWYEQQNAIANDFTAIAWDARGYGNSCLLYTSPSPRDATLSRMPSSA